MMGCGQGRRIAAKNRYAEDTFSELRNTEVGNVYFVQGHAIARFDQGIEQSDDELAFLGVKESLYVFKDDGAWPSVSRESGIDGDESVARVVPVLVPAEENPWQG